MANVHGFVYSNIYIQRGLRHCLSSEDGQCESLVRGMSDEFRFPRFFFTFIFIYYCLWESGGVTNSMNCNMKRFFILWVTALFFSEAMSQTVMSGVYTVGKTAQYDFKSIGDALTVLDTAKW